MVNRQCNHRALGRTSRTISSHLTCDHMLPYTSELTVHVRHCTVRMTLEAPLRSERCFRSIAQLRIFLNPGETILPRVHSRPLAGRSPVFIQRNITAFGRLPPVAKFRPSFNPCINDLWAFPKRGRGVLSRQSLMMARRRRGKLDTGVQLHSQSSLFWHVQQLVHNMRSKLQSH